MEFFIYLSKSATILFLFYLVYIIVLRKDTFFTANRFYLLSGIIAAIILPLLTFTQTVFVEIPLEIPQIQTTYESSSDATVLTAPTTTPFNWWYLAISLYLLGVVYMVSLFLIRLGSLLRLLQKHPSKKHNGFIYVQVEDATAPFSFFNYIVYNANSHSEEELQMILKHEQVHASQWHSLDVLAAHLLRAIHWLNPISWWYKKSLEANLEFIADDQTAQQAPSKEAYQLALVKASSALQTPVLTTNFYQSFTRLTVFGKQIKIPGQFGQVKKRIIMLNKDHSNQYNRLKLSLIVPVLGLFLWSFNTHEVVEYIPAKTSEVASTVNNELLTFSTTTTNAQLDVIEEYMAAHHPTMLIKIANRKRNEQNELVQFSFQTKFEGNDRFYTRFDRSTDYPFTTTYQIQPEENNTLVVHEQGKYDDGVQLLISKENLKITSAAISPIGANAATKDNSDDTHSELGENPLYIINDKSYRQNQLPEHEEIHLDGSIKTYNKKEGLKKYGTAGSDGVLHFDGVSTFVKQKNKGQTTPTKVTQQGTVLNTRVHSLAQVNTSIKRIQFPITKHTTDAQLDQYAAEAKSKYGYEVSFTVNRNSNNEITGLKIMYSGNGNSGNINNNSGGPIPDSYFFIDDETGGAGFVNEGSEERMEEMRERMEMRRAEMQERREEREVMRGEAMERRKALREESRDIRRESLRDSINGNSELLEEEREIIQERRVEQRDRMRAMREKHRVMRDSMRGMARINSHIEDEEREIEKEYERHATAYAHASGHNTHGLAHVDHNEHAIIIDKNTTDATLETMKANLEKKGVKFSYKRLKRNSKGEITGIRLVIDNGKGSKITKSVSSDDGEPIDELLVKI